MALTPYWPLLMDEGTACRFLCLGIRELNELVAEGYLPPARPVGLGIKRWTREELERLVQNRIVPNHLSRSKLVEAEIVKARAALAPNPLRRKKR